MAEAGVAVGACSVGVGQRVLVPRDDDDILVGAVREPRGVEVVGAHAQLVAAARGVHQVVLGSPLVVAGNENVVPHVAAHDALRERLDEAVDRVARRAVQPSPIHEDHDDVHVRYDQLLQLLRRERGPLDADVSLGRLLEEAEDALGVGVDGRLVKGLVLVGGVDAGHRGEEAEAHAIVAQHVRQVDRPDAARRNPTSKLLQRAVLLGDAESPQRHLQACKATVPVERLPDMWYLPLQRSASANVDHV
mmetsp:Transcript_29912/g.63042  ORF Transcript_29912/g.63042 Transcript_29912/m.63042 type:complete len:248 (-) Transcript_29912:418-1161(-)